MLDYLWIENRGMSIVTSIFFMGIFMSMSAIIWWVQKETKRLEAKMAESVGQVGLAQTELVQMNLELAVIRTTVDKMDESLDRLIEKIYP